MTSNGDQAPRAGSEGLGSEAAAEGNTTTAPRARLTRLKINRFRNVEPGTELRFDDGINVLFGRNGTGKTTLLELVCAVVSGDLRAYRRESFDLEFEMVLSRERISVAVQNTFAHRDTLAALLDTGSHDATWSYRILFETNEGTCYRIDATEGASRLRQDSEVTAPRPLPETPLFTPGFHERSIDSAVNESGKLAFPAYRMQQRLLLNNCLRLDEGLDLFRATVEGVALPRLEKPLRASLFSGFPWKNPGKGPLFLLELSSYYLPASLLECLVEIGDTAHERTEISISGAQWHVLGEIERIFGAKSLQVTVQLVERLDLGEGTHSIFGKPVFRITTHQGTTFTHDHLSYGEKRLLAFMYHAACNPQILVADEIVNGLHHGWIQACLDAIQGQAFLTSQNPLLLDHLSFESAEEVQRRFVLCDTDESGKWIWRNMDIDAADAFYRAYEVGLQHVGEILRTSGLW